MNKIVKLEAYDTQISIETTEIAPEEYGLKKSSSISEKSLTKLLSIICPFTKALRNTVDELGEDKPDSMSADFGLSVAAEGNIFFIKASGQGTINIHLEWNKH